MIYGALFTGLLMIFWIVSGIFTNKTDDIFLGRNSTNIMKGIAILCVVICHFMGSYGEAIRIFTPLGGIGVSIFLILSAYGLNESWNHQGYRAWWRKRIIAVVVPYAILQCILYWPFREFQILDFVLDIFCINPKYGNGWYLSYLMLWYLVYWIVRRFELLNKHRIIAFCIISGGMFCYFTLRSPIRTEQSLAFLVGILLSEYKDLHYKVTNKKVIVGLLMLGVGFLAIKQLPITRNASQVVYGFVELLIKTPCGLGIMSLAWHMMKKVNMKMFEWIGLFSYELYIIHGYVLAQTSIDVVGTFVFTMASFGGAILFWCLLKRTKNLQRKVLRISSV